MEDFLMFLQQNWQWLVTVFISVLSIILLVLKKTNIIKQDTVWTKVLTALPGFIIQAEIDHPEAKAGRDKYKEVLIAAVDYYQKISGKDFPDDLIEKINDAVEAILAAPQKK